MRPIKSEEIQPLLLSMLKAFDRFAKKNNIQYYAAGGTLLGAIRHHGFIPWDDDIDLFIREDAADKLLNIVRDNPFIDSENRYQILLPAVSPNVYPIIKLVDTKTVAYEKNISKKYGCGIWIDIFNMVYWPNDLNESKKLFARQKMIKKMLQITIFGNLKKNKYKVIAPFASIIKGVFLASGRNCEYWSQRLYRLGSKEPTRFIGNISWSASINDRYPVEYYNEAIEMQFEDTMIPVPASYDAILTQFYGDYLELPPVEKRVRHDFEAYYIE